MTEILRSPPQQLLSTSTAVSNAVELSQHSLVEHDPVESADFYRRRCRSGEIEEEAAGDQLPVLAVFLTVFRKSLVGCRSRGGVQEQIMEIGCPTDVRHVAHVTFDKFNGFLGLPVEFEPEVPRRPPSARSALSVRFFKFVAGLTLTLLWLSSTTVFGVSTDSMQLSFDSRGNCVPTILLMTQRCLYSQRGLQSEGIFRINPENGQEEYAREQLNNGLIPEDIDVHCLAGLIKAWFRELPKGVLDALNPEQVMAAQSEEECSHLVRLLPPTEAALLDWAVNLMADVAQLEHLNKMNARNIAMVFAPNMTQMSDPLTALMYAVQVMNFLSTLIVKTLRQREDSIVESDPTVQQVEHSDDDDRHPTMLKEKHRDEECEIREEGEEAAEESETGGGKVHHVDNNFANILISGGSMRSIQETGRSHSRIPRKKSGQPRSWNHVKKGSKKHTSQPEIYQMAEDERSREVSATRRANPCPEGR